MKNSAVEDLKVDALRLSPDARPYLARELLESLDALSGVEIEKLWLEEAVRRDAELDSGEARAYPAHDVIARARARFE